VAGGRSNKQVAGRLYLTEGTIENTLTRVYAKLGVRSRTSSSARSDAQTAARSMRRCPRSVRATRHDRTPHDAEISGGLVVPTR
jgi:hypothetical protein